MIKQALISIAFGTLALGAQGAAAQQFNGGIPTGWTCLGACGTYGDVNDVVGLSPISSSTKYGWVSTDPSANAVYGVSPFSPPPPVFGGETFPGNANGSLLRSSEFIVNAGDQLSLYFNYVTSDGGDFTDYGWSRLLNATDLSQAAVLFTARTDPSALYISGLDFPTSEATLTRDSVPIFDYSPLLNGGNDTGPFWTPLGPDSESCWGVGCGYSGWVRASYTFTTAGKYQLEFGVTNWIDEAWNSGMAIDGIVISPGNGGVTSPVPEPETYAMLLAGLSLLGLSARRRKQSNPATA